MPGSRNDTMQPIEGLGQVSRPTRMGGQSGDGPKCPLLRDSKKPEVGSEADLHGHREVTRLTPTGPQTC
jgi:hypothetical protein